MIEDVTVVNADALDCGVCCLPLKPPIFQCRMGHVVCSSCRDKLLAAAGTCHVCRAPTSGAGGYRRCHGMEDLVESIRVACPNAAHGCTARPAYYARDDHLHACPHAPCHCPARGCGFVGSTASLRGHFEADHGWPRTTEVQAGEDGRTNVVLLDGFNVVDVISGGAANNNTTSEKYLFLLMVSRERLGRAISAVCVRPRATDIAIRCDIGYRSGVAGHVDRQASQFDVACTDLSDGLPAPDDRFHAFVPRRVLQPDVDGDPYVSIELGFHFSEIVFLG